MEMQLTASNLDLLPHSLIHTPQGEYGLVRTPTGNKLAVLTTSETSVFDELEGEGSDIGLGTILLCPLNPHNARALRKRIPWLNPQLLGLTTSAGLGDRLGVATPGHVRAMCTTQGSVAPIFAQQSVREMRRTGRTPQQVIDDAMWGIFEEGWQGGFGADADHLKTKEDIDACLAAGFTFFTLDPGDYVENLSDEDNSKTLKARLEGLPEHLRPNRTDLLGKTIHIEGKNIIFDENVLTKASVKYGKAIDHIVDLYQHLKRESGSCPFEVEISMDETEQPTTAAEHIYVARQLHQRDVEWVSFAPRFIGRFEKGVDYIGDLRSFEADLAIHASIARQFGPYKLSLHSGSDKFSLYSIFMHHTRGLAHLKTAGTSYLEALRTIATTDPEFFKAIYTFALEHFEADKKSYHISAQINKAPKPDAVRGWTDLLTQFDARQILHVTFGSVLAETTKDGSHLFKDRMMQSLYVHRELYFDNLVRHFRRHLDPLAVGRDV